MTNTTTSPELTPTLNPADYRIRRLLPEDAVGVVACLRTIYGDSYVHTALYDPAEIIRLNETCELVSAVALDLTDRVVGHYALERTSLAVIAETGVALVLPEHRHHQLMEDMRLLLEKEARQLELLGLYGNVVTNHVFTQHVVERFGERPCAISLAWSPRTFHNMPEPLPQRMSELLYFKHLRRPAAMTVFVPTEHQLWCTRLYQQLDVDVQFGTEQPADGVTQFAVQSNPDVQRAIIRILQVGRDLPVVLRRLMQEQQRVGAEVIFVELPLSQAATPQACRTAEALGFGFSGIAPHFAPDGDALRLQWLAEPLDYSLIQVMNPLAQELLDYVAQEQARVNRAVLQEVE
ncbi:MAG: hypothetical protein SGJ20_21475 [Planctomycetota bacterium]|nr:hypothetical protein [Planctomycetota bacterium]